MKNLIPGYMTEGECAFLRVLFARHNQPGAVGFEIGSLVGRSAYEISQTIPLGTLVCVDSWSNWSNTDPDDPDPDRYYIPKHGMISSLEAFRNNTKDCKNILTVRGYSPQCISKWKAPVDFVFLDAGHWNPNDRQNLRFFLPLLKRGATLAGHDFRDHPETKWPDVVENVRWLERIFRKDVQSHESIWYFQL
jgi:predicted O-methyltransferase YrrM